MARVTFKTKAECEYCGNLDVDVHLMYGNSWMCAPCKADEASIAARAKDLSEKSREATAMIFSSRRQDETIELKEDIYKSKIPAAVELRAAIEADDSIPADQKAYRYAKETERRALHLRNVLMPEQREILNNMANEYRVWANETATNAATFQEKVRTEFANLDVSYSPVKVKVTQVAKTRENKPTKTRASAPRINMPSVVEASKKYGVPAHALTIMMRDGRNLSAEQAAKEFLRNSGAVAR